MKSNDLFLISLAFLIVIGGCTQATVSPTPEPPSMEVPIIVINESESNLHSVSDVPSPVVNMPVEEEKCVDTEGVDIRTKGSAGGLSDSCDTPVTLSEKICIGSTTSETKVTCPGGCDDGKCVDGSLASLSGYPGFLDKDNVLIVVGDKAPSTHVQAAIELATSLTSAFNKEVKTVLASEVESINSQDLVLIGNACQNEMVAEIYGNPSPCDDKESTGQGRIEVLSGEGKEYVIVTGKDDATMRIAARALSKYNDHSFYGSSAKITGTLDNPVVS